MNSKDNTYNPSLIEKKWQAIWEKNKIYSPDLNSGELPFYNLMMFPYPSAEGMHVGNMHAFTGADVYGRFKRMQGNDVFEPIGLDGFGIHSENYALKTGRHPVEQAKTSEMNFYRQLHSIGNSFDWTRTVETYKPEYYKWTQWLFIQLFKAGLAYRKKAPVNFCPSCKTVLSDEQVIDGCCERCNSVVEKRDLEQWFFKITKYADRLLSGLSKIDWVEKVKTAQRNWIGKSEGALIKFKIDDSPHGEAGLGFKNKEIEVFTTRPDTLFGATFLVISPELAQKWLSVGRKAPEKVKSYVQNSLKLADMDRSKEDREKTGVFTGIYAINPANQEKMPVWIADFIIGSYGTGAVFADAHDERDFEFAKKYKIPLKPTLKTGNRDLDEKIINLEMCFTGDGILFDSGEFSGLTSAEARKKIVAWLNEKAQAKQQVNYHLRDWLISRQRYWGPPIPMIYCEKCQWQPVPEKDLPVLLPYIKDYKPMGTGKSPLANHPEFYKTNCPKCNGAAKRETDVSDTFLDSAWYFLRYVSTDIDNTAFDAKRVKKWLPVNMYIGGVEHSVLHLLYSRFMTMVLSDLGLISFEEPFTKFRAHGLIIKDGAKMSKSKGNVVIPDEYIRKFGADTVRSYLMFAGPFEMGGDFRDTGIEGTHRFVKRIWRLVSSIKQQVLSMDKKGENSDLDRLMHKTIKAVTEDIEKLNYNTAIAHLMEYYNELSAFYTKYKILNAKYCKTLVLLFAPFAPHISEELYQLLNENKAGKFLSIHNSSWPQYDPRFLEASQFMVVVQVNGKLRGNIIVDKEILNNQVRIEELVRQNQRVMRYLEGKQIRKVIYVEGRVINFVVE
ncbi:MAG: leucine--tRNA ligase [Candidatus Levybacteria bacterium]|nr:leucine--tRNA ligase [Candidatus Levybacteria bacterium]